MIMTWKKQTVVVKSGCSSEYSSAGKGNEV